MNVPPAAKVRWTKRAFADLDSIFDAIAADRPESAQRVVRELLAQAEALGSHPHRGRPGRVRQTRELVLPRLPYVIVYSLRRSLVEVRPDVSIVRVIHGAMRWPSRRA